MFFLLTEAGGCHHLGHINIIRGLWGHDENIVLNKQVRQNTNLPVSQGASSQRFPEAALSCRRDGKEMGRGRHVRYI